MYRKRWPTEKNELKGENYKLLGREICEREDCAGGKRNRVKRERLRCIKKQYREWLEV